MATSIALPERQPINATFELTVRCNLKCKMCLFRHSDDENAQIIKTELTARQWSNIASQAAEMGVGGILITGGEPLLRKDFCEIYESIYRQGFLITLYTNATLVTPEIMELFKKYPPHKIGISIYGATPETYLKVCGNESAFERMLEGSKSLCTLPSVIEFRTTIIKDNFDDSRAIDNLVRDNFGEKYSVIRTRMVMKSVRGACTDVEACRLSPEDNVKLSLQRSIDILRERIGDSFDEKNIRIRRENIKKCADCGSSADKRYSLFGCNGGMSDFAITWDGRLQACQVLGAFHTDVKELGLKKAWEQFPYAVKLPDVNEKCLKCRNNEICQSCYALRYAETGSLSGCPEYACADSEAMNSYLC